MLPFSMNNVLLTRKCNLSCDYCRIIRDYDNSPYEPTWSISEVDHIKWFDFGKWVKDYTNGFIILYGGEPFLYPYIEELLYLYNKYDIDYTVITNGILKNKILSLVENGTLRSLSCSVDPNVFYEQKSDRVLKSNRGFELLSRAKKINPDIDVTAEIVVDNTNHLYLKTLVEKLTENDIWASITIIESSKNKYYDFAEPCDDLLLSQNQIEELIQTINKLVEKGYKIHSPESILEILNTYKDSRTYYCKDTILYNYATSTIEPDGTLRLCLRIKGERINKFNIFDYVRHNYSPDEVVNEIIKDLGYDFDKMCEGCAWTCSAMPKINMNHIKHRV